MPLAISYEVKNDEIFAKKMLAAGRMSSDLRIPLTLIAKDFFKSQRAIWKLKSPGLYPDLAPSTKKQRRRDRQQIYPILFRSGTLKKSMTNPTDSNAVNQIVNKNELFIGTKVAYGIHHQFGAPRAKVPMRKFLFIGPEAPRFALGPHTGRIERWIGIFDKWMLQILRRNFK